MPQKGQYTVTIKDETKDKLDQILKDFGSYDQKINELIRIHNEFISEVENDV